MKNLEFEVFEERKKLMSDEIKTNLLGQVISRE